MISMLEIDREIKGCQNRINRFRREIELEECRIDELKKLQGAVQYGSILPDQAKLTDYIKQMAGGRA